MIFDIMYPTYLENNRKSEIVKNAISLVRLRLDWDLEVGEISKMESDHNDTISLEEFEELKENINSFYRSCHQHSFGWIIRWTCRSTGHLLD